MGEDSEDNDVWDSKVHTNSSKRFDYNYKYANPKYDSTLEWKICPKCGRKFDNDVKICSYCKYKFN